MPFTGFSTLHWISLFLCVTSHGCVGSWLCTAGSPIPATNWIKNYFRTQVTRNFRKSFWFFQNFHCLSSFTALISLFTISFCFILAPNFKSKHNTGCFPRKDYILLRFTPKSKTLSSYLILDWTLWTRPSHKLFIQVMVMKTLLT